MGGLETLEGVTKEWQAHLRVVLALRLAVALLPQKMGGVIGLVNLVDWEVGHIDVGGQLGLKWSADGTKLIKINTTEELVVLDLLCIDTSKAILGVADKTIEECGLASDSRCASRLGHTCG